jgi:hypothetical protein
MASKGRVIYVGMTGFLRARVLRHKAGTGGVFTRNYRVHRQWHLESNASCDKTFGAGSKSLQLGLANSLGFSHPKDYNNTSDECVQLGCVLN